MKSSPNTPDLEGAIASMQALKVEHAPILAQLARDPGMAPDTRALLVAHLLEEEDEKLAVIAAAAGSAAAGSATSSHSAKLTVGSLRTTSSSPHGEPAPRTTTRSIGSLRAR